jgi:hypothetical protein
MSINRKGTDGTGRDIPTVYVPSRPVVSPFAARDNRGHSGTLSRLSLVSRPECPVRSALRGTRHTDVGGAQPAREAV